MVTLRREASSASLFFVYDETIGHQSSLMPWKLGRMAAKKWM